MSEIPAHDSQENEPMPASCADDSSIAESRESMCLSGNGDPLSKLISELVLRRAQGERITNDQIIALHPELMPALRDELSALDAIHRSVVMGQIQDFEDSPVDPLSGNPVGNTIPAESASNTYQRSGMRLQGYCIEREISSGGQATVFKAVQERTGRVVALKIIHGGPFVGTRARRRFERESRILAKLNHPNVVSILDRGRTTDGSFFLVMDFIDGRDLNSYIKELGGDSISIVRIFIKIAKAVDEAHQYGVVHRDLKPMNILVDTRGEPHVLDFGMASLLKESANGAEEEVDQTTLTRTGQVLGSLPWTSPEQVSASPDGIDARSDVYSLGVMLFAALAGEFPYPVKGSPHAVSQNIVGTSPGSLTSLARRNGIIVASSLEDIVLKALRKAPSRRYATAGLLADDLEAFLAGRSRSSWRIGPRARRLVTTLALMAGFFMVSLDSSPVTSSATSFVNTVGMRFVRIPAGAIPVGRRLDETREAYLRNTPWFRVDRPFYMSATVVTQQQFRRIIGRNSSDPRLNDLDSPVQYVNWAEATEFCYLLSRQENRTYRLPTSEEWKYAYFSGSAESGTQMPGVLDRAAWYAGNSGLRLHPVAQKLPDRWGLYDMIGEVRQWCSSPPHRATASSANIAASQKLPGVVEGADFLSPASDCFTPSKLEMECAPESALPTIGFRVVCESPEQDRANDRDDAGPPGINSTEQPPFK